MPSSHTTKKRKIENRKATKAIKAIITSVVIAVVDSTVKIGVWLGMAVLYIVYCVLKLVIEVKLKGDFKPAITFCQTTVNTFSIYY